MGDTAPSSEVTLNKQHVLASRNFRLLWVGQAIAAFGDKFTEIAIPILVYTITGSATQLGVAFLVQVFSTLVFGLLAGVVADRWDRKLTMVWSDILRAALIFLILLVPTFFASTTSQLGALYVLSFVIAAVKQFFVPAKVATIPDIVDESQLMAANSLDQSTMTLIAFLGYAAAGFLVDRIGAEAAFMVNIATFLVSALFIGFIHIPPQAAKDPTAVKPSIIAGIREGIRFVWSVPILQGTAVLSIIAPSAVGATQVLLVIFSHDVLRADAAGYGLLEGIFGLGIAFGAFLLGRYANHLRRGFLFGAGVVGMGVGQLVAVAAPALLLWARPEAPSAWLMAVCLPFFFLGAACNAAVFVGVRTIVQENVPRQMIGRVFSVITVLSSIAMGVGASLAGLADYLGVTVTILLWSVVLVLSGAAALMWRTFREA